jgi:hypothetical protein
MMTTRRRIVGLGVGLALAAGSVLTASASAALPELGRCVSRMGGQYANNGCTTLSTTPKTKLFEWEPGALANGFTIKGTGLTITTEPSKTRMTCSASAGRGIYTSATTAEITQLELTGCEEKSFKVKCQTEAAEGNSTEGRINVYPLDGALGKVSGTKAGVLLTGTVPNPFSFGQTPLAYHFECGEHLTGKGTQVFGENGVIGETIATDRMSLTSKLKFAKNVTTLKQAIRHFEGEADEHELVEILFGPCECIEAANLVANPLITNEEPLEIKAK